MTEARHNSPFPKTHGFPDYNVLPPTGLLLMRSEDLQSVFNHNSFELALSPLRCKYSNGGPLTTVASKQHQRTPCKFGRYAIHEISIFGGVVHSAIETQNPALPLLSPPYVTILLWP